MRWWNSRCVCALLAPMIGACADATAPHPVGAARRTLALASDAGSALATPIPLGGPLDAAASDAGGHLPPDAAPPGTTAPELASCCVAADTPGCAEAAVVACLCEIDPFCCSERHDALCVREAVSSCGLSCAPPPALNDCCSASPSPGCSAAPVLACVCDIDPGCCQLRFDQSCANLAVARCGASCEQEGAP